MFKRFWSSRSGNFALMTGVLTVPLVLGIGMAVDYSRHVSAKKHLQEIADSVSLSLAASKMTNMAQLTISGQKTINANESPDRIDVIDPITKGDITLTANSVDVQLSGHINTMFMGIAGYKILDVKASSLAMRAVNGGVEVALVLDNTWSMSETDAGGVAKIDALKSSANSLIEALMADPSAGVKISLVPYADVVNVGVGNRNKPWVSVPDDVAAVAPICTTTDETITTDCDTWVHKMCPTTRDGVSIEYDCSYCSQYKPPYVGPVTRCSGQVWGTTWFGCVGSRMPGTTRLDDQSPSVPYPGFNSDTQYCPTPIVPLTTSKTTLKTSVSGMIINFGWWYQPSTYIPAGMIWGVNVLSPSAPFSEGAGYDKDNKKPRKAIVLMTDGENTLQFRASDGRPVQFSSDAATARSDYLKVNSETNQICDYAKKKNIEIFSVAFMVDNPDAKAMLQGCASSSDHYFDASDKDGLQAAFSDIAQSLSVVRLAR